jgi:PilZ domain
VRPFKSLKNLVNPLNESELNDVNDHRARKRHGVRIVFKERRKNPRRKINCVAQFYNEICPAPRACLVTDYSEVGARLYTEIEMPPTFTLSLSGEGVNVRRECRVVWRLGGELGVEFIDGASR